MKAGGSRKGEGTSRLELAAAGKVFRDDGVVPFLAKFVGIAREGGEKS